MSRPFQRCQRCGGSLLKEDGEDRASDVWRCLSCGRVAYAEQRTAPILEPVREELFPEPIRPLVIAAHQAYSSIGYLQYGAGLKGEDIATQLAISLRTVRRGAKFYRRTLTA